MDIVKLLRMEHERALMLFNQVDALGISVAKDTVLQQLLLELTVHERAEEASLWPALREQSVEQALGEEQQLLHTIDAIMNDLDDARLDTEVGDLRAMLLHHIQTEENQLFPLALKRLDEAQRRRLSQAYIRAKATLMQQVPAPQLRVTMAPEALARELEREERSG